jgi:hypothetical protein
VDQRIEENGTSKTQSEKRSGIDEKAPITHMQPEIVPEISAALSNDI